MGLSTGHMRYVICPKCGDAVAGDLKRKPLICVHCAESIELDESQIRQGLVTFDDSTNRWQVARGI